MDALVIEGGNRLAGEVTNSGAKNVALKTLVASLLTDEVIRLHNIPHITDVVFMFDVLRSLGIDSHYHNHTVTIGKKGSASVTVPLDVGARLRTSSMVIGPMLARYGEARIPNPGGCRIGARPIDRHITALRSMGARITYSSRDGYYHATAKKLYGAHVRFPKNTHTGTETIILAAVLASGQTVIENAAQEVEIDDLILFLNRMGAKIKRSSERTITIDGVSELHGAEYTIMSDRNEEVTFAIAAAVTQGDITVQKSQRAHLTAFHDAFRAAGGIVEDRDTDVTRYRVGRTVKATDIVTKPHPGFMTDWQAPWAVLMTQAHGVSTIHETVFESRFSYVKELLKMGARITFFDPAIDNPKAFYNFNLRDKKNGDHQAIRIHGPRVLHNAVVTIDDLRAGATLILAALAARGESYVYGIEQVDRGYENIEERLRGLGARMHRIQ